MHKLRHWTCKILDLMGDEQSCCVLVIESCVGRETQQTWREIHNVPDLAQALVGILHTVAVSWQAQGASGVSTKCIVESQ